MSQQTDLRCISLKRSLPVAVIMVLLITASLTSSPVAAAKSWQQDAGPDLVVCPTCDMNSIGQALTSAQPGARIEVRAGTYPGPVLIERDVTLVGVDNPVIDGAGVGTIITVRGASAAISGFTIKGTGTSLHREDAAILVDSGRATVEGNRIEDALFGIYVKNSPGSILRDNVILGKPLPVASRGDGIRVWYCDDMIIENNTAQDGRDVILWYSNRGIVQGNQFDRGRYGLHLMFSDAAFIKNNSLSGNSIGLYVMYSRNVSIVGNALSDNRGPSGGGLGLKDVDGAEVIDNRFVNNQIGAHVDTSPREPNIEHFWKGNVFAYNETALGLMPSVRNNTLSENAFIDNLENVAILGGGQLRNITWAVEERGNYWSDYVGYDANGDGIGDVPYRSQQLFESLIDRHPSLRLFIFSPAAMAIDFAARAFPSVRPREKFVDPAPLMSPPLTAGLPGIERASAWSRLLGGGAGFVLASCIVVVARLLRRRIDGIPGITEEVEEAGMLESAGSRASVQAPTEAATSLITVREVTKKYGDAIALNDISFTVSPGEAVAMWGPNGAGKTTILRCLLGIARFSGDVRVNGLDPVTDGPTARSVMGYVPQDLAPSPMPVGEMAAFIARLKGSTEAEARQHLERMGIADQINKPISALSGGMKQRLALALALIGSPRVLLLDEPTANLDATGRADLLHLLRELKRDGMTLVFSSHRPDDVLALADRILMMDRGILTQSATPKQFAELIDAQSRLLVTLANGHMSEAITALQRMGYEATHSGKVLAVAVQASEKAQLISALVREGIEIDDVELERVL